MATNIRFFVLTYAPIVSSAAHAAAAKAPSYDLKAGQELTFTAAISEGQIILGPPRLGRFGTAQPRAGEITVGLSPKDKSLYEDVVVTEKTSVPLDFVATGWIGEIKIDERILCGRIDQPVTQRIGATSWKVGLSQFQVGKGAGDCE